MVKRKVELNIISAEGLKLSTLFGKPHTYAVAWIKPSSKFYTHVSEEGASNPVWNHKVILSANNYSLEHGSGKFTVEIFHRGHIHDKLLGTVEVPFKEIPDHVRFDPQPESPVQYMAFEIRRPSGKTKGILNLSIRLRELCSSSSSSSCSSDSEVALPHHVEELPPPRFSEPPRAYPPPAPEKYAPGYPALVPPAYAPPPPSYPTPSTAYPAATPPYPPSPAYPAPGYPSYPGFYNAQPRYQPVPEPFYGAAAAAPPKPYYGTSAAAAPPKSGHSNLALGAGIAAGALGGLVLGEVVENIADNAADEAVENVEYGDDDVCQIILSHCEHFVNEPFS